MIDYEFTILVPNVSVLGKEHILPNYKLHFKLLNTFIIFSPNILVTNVNNVRRDEKLELNTFMYKLVFYEHPYTLLIFLVSVYKSLDGNLGNVCRPCLDKQFNLHLVLVLTLVMITA